MNFPRLKLAFPFLLFGFLAVLTVWSNIRGGADDTDAPPVGTVVAQVPSGRLIDPVCKMDVNAAWGHSHSIDGHTYHFCNERCRDSFAADPNQYLTERCLVCSELIDPATEVSATYLGKTYRLNSEQCRREFKADPAGFFMHRMWGLPDELYYISIGLVLLVSFLMIEGVAYWRRSSGRTDGSADMGSDAGPISEATSPSIGQRITATLATCIAGLKRDRSSNDDTPVDLRSDSASAVISLPVIQSSAHVGALKETDRPLGARFDLMKFAPLRWLFTSRKIRFVVQLFMVFMFLLIIAVGLFGNQNPSLNIAPLTTWTLWWCGLVVLIMFAGKAWCYMCPWDAIAGWMEKLKFWKKSESGLGLNIKWPRRLRNIWLATFLFIGLTWLELGFGITMKPAATAYLAIAMLVMTIVCAFLFDRKSFCRYGCLVGRVSGLYAMFGGTEVRSIDADVCANCRTKECIKGSDDAYGCPTFENPGKMDVNTYCIQCGECLQSCPHQNMTVQLRPWGADLAAQGKPRSDEAYLALLMLAMSGFHGLTMTPVWQQMLDAIEGGFSSGRVISFSIGMALFMAAPILVYAALIWSSYRITRASESMDSQRVSYRDYFIRYAYCVLPIALFYHLAHNLEHLLMEGPKVMVLASDPFGWGWNLFGTASWSVPPLVSLDMLWIMQIILVAVGHIYSLWAARVISRRVFADPTAASRGQWPMLLGMIAFSVFSLWLLKQPMEMRTSAM